MACFLTVRVKAGSSSSQIIGVMADGSLRVRLKSQPVRGEANRELVTLLAAKLGVPASSVNIMRGETARVKRIRIDGVDRTRAMGLLGETT